MKLYNVIADIISKYIDAISVYPSIHKVYIRRSEEEPVDEKLIDKFRKRFAPGIDSKEVIACIDPTVVHSGKCGIIFTTEKIYCKGMLSKPIKVWYEDIEELTLTPAKKDSEAHLIIKSKDGDEFEFDSFDFNKTPLRDCLLNILKIINQSEQFAAELGMNYVTKQKPVDVDMGGFIFADVSNAATLYGEDKFATPRGHGFAAERVNHLHDVITGKNAKIVGDNNSKNGADRIVNGVRIQSKFCASGAKCISECFNENGFRYYNIDGTPMQIEVPKDMYDAAVQSMRVRIERGEISGVTDPNEAENIVRKSPFTYQQVKNIAKAGTIESITYDAVNGAIIATSTFGITTLVSFAVSLWNGEDLDIALQNAACEGLKVGGIAFASAVLAGQLSKAGLNSLLVGSSEYIVNLIGPKAAAFLVNAFRSGQNIYGAAAMKSAAKLLRNNAITGTITVLLLSSVDVVNIFRGRISGKQLFKDLASTGASVVGGTAGWAAGTAGAAALGAAIGSVFPGVGTVIGGTIGTIVGGVAGAISGGTIAGKASDSVVGLFVEDDAKEMLKIIESTYKQIAEDYLLSRKECEKLADRLKDKLSAKTLKDMYAADNKKILPLT